MVVWFSTELKTILGQFVKPKGWNPISPRHHVTAYGVALDEIVFETLFPSAEFLYLQTIVSTNPNVSTLMHILTDLVPPDSTGTNMGTIATCRLPTHLRAVALARE